MQYPANAPSVLVVVAGSKLERMEGHALCLDLGALHWRVGLCGEEQPWLNTATDHPSKYVSDEQVAAHPLAGQFGLDDLGVQPMLLANEVLEQAIANAPGARQYLWELHCEMLEDALRESRYTIGSRAVVCTLPLFTEPDSAAMTERLRIIFGESGPFRRAGLEVEKLLFAHPEVLVLYSIGRTTGLSVNLGSNIVTIAVYEGSVIESAARRHPWPRDDEALLPQLVSIIIDALEACPLDTQRDLAQNIVISGETSLNREELRCRSPTDLCKIDARESATDLALWNLQEALRETGRRTDYRLNVDPERSLSAWIGGSVLGSLSDSPWGTDSWVSEHHGGLRIDSAQYRLYHGCYWPSASPPSLVLEFDKSDDTAFATRLLAWAKAVLFCAYLDDSFDLEVVHMIGTEARTVWEASPRSLRGLVMQSDADAMLPLPLMVLHGRMSLGSEAIRQPMSSLEPTGPGICGEDTCSYRETWQDLWTALAVADNDVPDPSGQLHRPPDELRAMQQAGLHPVRSAAWLLLGRNWIGNRMHNRSDGLYMARHGHSMFPASGTPQPLTEEPERELAVEGTDTTPPPPPPPPPPPMEIAPRPPPQP